MGYELAAAIAQAQIMQAPHFSTFRHVKSAELRGGLILVPITEALFDEIQDASTEEHVRHEPYSKFGYLPISIVDWLRELSHACEVGYVEADYFGGNGFQSSIAWKDGQISFNPVHDINAINQLLKHMGVQAGPSMDEFETVRLGRHRHTEEWIDG